MKHKRIIATLLFNFIVLYAFAQNGAEKISLSFQNTPLKEAMVRIEKETGYVFSYDATKIDISTSVSLNARNEVLRFAMIKMFEPTDIAVRFNNSMIYLSPKQTEAVKVGG